MGKVKKASSVTASIALCALLPLNFLTAHGHTLPESQSSANLLHNNLEDNRPALVLPETTHKTALLPPAAILTNPLVQPTVVNQKNTLNVVTTRETGHASLYLNQKEVIKFRADAQDSAGVWQTPTERATAAYNILNKHLNDPKLVITPTVNSGRVYLTVNQTPFAEVDTLTARQTRTTPQTLALVWTSKVKQALSSAVVSAKAVTPLKTAVIKNFSSLLLPKRTGTLASGRASWYGPGFHGRRAANGSIFNQFAMTAAHKTLPFGTLVRVTNKANGKQCVVKITDRGPFCGGRVIDLSRRAAESLGMLGSGVASVNIESMPNG